MPAQDNSYLRCVGDWKETYRQTWPPSLELSKVWPDNVYPLGEISDYTGDQAFRTTSEEKKVADKLMENEWNNLRKASEVHRQARRWFQSWVRPGVPLTVLCERLEAKTAELVGALGASGTGPTPPCGWGFPTGVSLNHVAAHYTPNHGDKTVLTYDDVMKVDFGVQVGGRIVDSAFTVAFNPKYDAAIESTKDATNTGLRLAGVDARFSEIGAAIEEVIGSYEVELDGKTHTMKPIRNLNGHSIAPYQIHGGKSVPIVKTGGAEGLRMEENEVYAIETFASANGKGIVHEEYECSHYMRIFDLPKNPTLRLPSAKNVLNAVTNEFGSLAFCRRWLDDRGHTKHLMGLKNLCQSGYVTPYPPLVEQKGAIVTQMEHTVIIRPNCKEIVSRGDDY